MIVRRFCTGRVEGGSVYLFSDAKSADKAIVEYLIKDYDFCSVVILQLSNIARKNGGYYVK